MNATSCLLAGYFLSSPHVRFSLLEEEMKKPSLPLRIWRSLRRKRPGVPRANWAEKSTVLITIAIGIIAGVQARIYSQQKKIMESSGAQTDKIIAASNIQAAAAERVADASAKSATAAADFSASAQGMDTKIQSAVNEFHRIAADSERSIKATREASDKALNTSIEASRLDERAWFGVSSFDVLQYDPDDPKKPFSFQIWFRNSGKTPARQIHALGTFAAYNSRNAGPTEADWNTFLGFFSKSIERYVAAPNATRRMIINSSADQTTTDFITQNSLAIKNHALFLYFFGQATYVDIDNKPHTTKFCLVLADLETKQFAYCGKGNDMD
jgi:hypothetical protein